MPRHDVLEDLEQRANSERMILYHSPCAVDRIRAARELLIVSEKIDRLKAKGLTG